MAAWRHHVDHQESAVNRCSRKVTHDAQQLSRIGPAAAFGCVRDSQPSTSFRYQLATKFRHTRPTNFRHTVSTAFQCRFSTNLRYGLSTRFQHNLSIKFRDGEFAQCSHGRFATRGKFCFSRLNGEWVLLRRMSGLAIQQLSFFVPASGRCDRRFREFQRYSRLYRSVRCKSDRNGIL
jgi:hypothetical protein